MIGRLLRAEVHAATLRLDEIGERHKIEWEPTAFEGENAIAWRAILPEGRLCVWQRHFHGGSSWIGEFRVPGVPDAVASVAKRDPGAAMASIGVVYRDWMRSSLRSWHRPVSVDDLRERIDRLEWAIREGEFRRLGDAAALRCEAAVETAREYVDSDQHDQRYLRQLRAAVEWIECAL